ncbi:cytochrome c1 [Oceaniglobus indicus]|uniref:cytochrome c1 n=1 Tax=Oceaniglobus indicus TaxID=2047749 RepID=UPI000C1A6F2C|nr:cytochrome c1 [Oceaniglobus indicus]
MLKHLTLAAAFALALPSGAALAAEGGHVDDVDFSFEGPFGTYDQQQLQRGLQVYTEICSACHGLQYLTYRDLAAPGGPELPEDQVRAYASQYEVFDPELADGEGDFRPAKETDHFGKSGLATAPDLTLMAKARAGFHGPYGLGINQFLKGMGGPEYIHALLTGYTGEEKEQAGTLFYENTAFPGGWISMPPALYGEDVTYVNGEDNSIDAQSKDVAAFLMWTAEPKLMARKQAGFVGVLMLILLGTLLYFTNKRIWLPIKGRVEADTPAK